MAWIQTKPLLVFILLKKVGMFSVCTCIAVYSNERDNEVVALENPSKLIGCSNHVLKQN